MTGFEVFGSGSIFQNETFETLTGCFILGSIVSHSLLEILCLKNRHKQNEASRETRVSLDLSRSGQREKLKPLPPC